MSFKFFLFFFLNKKLNKSLVNGIQICYLSIEILEVRMKIFESNFFE